MSRSRSGGLTSGRIGTPFHRATRFRRHLVGTAGAEADDAAARITHTDVRVGGAHALRTLDELDYDGVAAIELPRHAHDAPAVAARCMTALHDAWEAR